ncbi:MAG: GMC family oxidoreductase [Alphaproteobacteria bacterium]
MINHTCDVLIIGSGAGGTMAARELANSNLGLDILVVEEGPHRPATQAPTSLHESLSSMWRQGGLTMAFGKTPISYAEGQCVGGGTEINSAIMQQTPADLREAWVEKYQIDDFSPTQWEQGYADIFKLLNASTTVGELGQASNLMAAMGKKMDWQTTALQRAQKHCVGTNHCSLGCPTGGKHSMSTALWPTLQRQGVRLMAGVRMQRIHHRHGQALYATGVEHTVQGTRPCTIHFKTLILAAGATQTPALLQRSRLIPWSSTGFLLHPTIRVTATFKDPIHAPTSRLPLYAITEFMPHVRLGGSVATLPTLGMFAMEDPKHRAHHAPAWRHSIMYYAMAKGEGFGRITALPFGAPPVVQYQLAEADWQNLQLGLSKLAEGLFAVGAQTVQPSIGGMPAWTSLADMRQRLPHGLTSNAVRKACQLMSIHLFSSIRMGAPETGALANSYGKLHGMTNLYVADASLIPESPGVNPQATVMLLAQRSARYALAQMEKTHA